MANESEILWVDVENNALLAGWEANTTATTPTFKQGDNIKVEVHFVKRVSTQKGIFFEEVPTAGSSFKLAVGNPDATPTGGFWGLGFGGNTADFLYNASAASVQTALNAFPNIAALGGVTVEKVNGNTTYRISFNQKVVLPNGFAGDATNLLPSSTVIADEIKVGSATTKGVWHIKPIQVPIAYQSVWTPQSSATVTATAVQLGTTRVKIAPAPKDGTFSLTVGTINTAPISVFATAFEVQAAITSVVDVDDATFEVKKSGSFIWDVSQTSGNLVSVTADGAGLISFDAIVGELNFNNYETSSLLAGATTRNTTLEIEMTTGATVATVLQTQCTIVANLIGEGVYATIPFEERLFDAPQDGNLYARKDGDWVSFQEEDNQGITQGDADARYLRQSNNLSDLTNLSVGRTNLGVYSTTEIDQSLALKANLSGATFTGKVSHTSVGGLAGLNVGIGGTSTSATTAGDLWISTGGTNLNFRDATGAWRVLATQGQTNTFSTNQIISGSTTTAMLRVTQTGTGEALRVEDEANPDTTPFIVGADGRVGIHGTPATNTNHKLAIYNGNIVFSAGFGLAFGDGTTMTSAATGNVTTGVTNTFTTNQIIAGTTTSPMLRITQDGTGDALRVQDVSGDTSAFVINQNGMVGINGEPHGATNFPLTINNGDIRFVGLTGGVLSGIVFSDGSRLSSAAGVGATTFFGMTDVDWDDSFTTPDTDGSFPVIRVGAGGAKVVEFVPSYYWNGNVSMPTFSRTNGNDTGDPSTSTYATLSVTFTKPILSLHTGQINVAVSPSNDYHTWSSNPSPYYNQGGASYGKILTIRVSPSAATQWSYDSGEGWTAQLTIADGNGVPLAGTVGEYSDILQLVGGDYKVYTEQTTSPYYDRPVTERGFQNALTLFLLQQNALPDPVATPRKLALVLDEQSQLWSMTPRSVFTEKVWLPSVTTTAAPLNIGTGSVNPTNPVAGDIWFNGDTLRYRMGSNNLDVALRNGNNAYTGTQTIDTSSSSTAVRITQRGLGNALVVEDSTFPDASAFVVNANGVVGIQRDPNAFSPAGGVVLDVNGKGVFTPTATLAGINIGTTASAPTSLTNGDLWIGDGFNFRNSNGIVRQALVNNTTNTISTASTSSPVLTVTQTGTAGAVAISANNTSPALRITQTGTGKALIVEDETSPDGTGMVIDQNGSVGIGVANTFTATHKLEVVGAVRANSITFDGTAQFRVNSTAAHGGGANTHDLFISYNGSTYRIPMIFVSTP